jgi:uncharacterized protein (DUF2267 family)
MTTGLDVFDTTLQQTNLSVKDLMKRLGTEDRKVAYQVLSRTLHAVRDRIGPKNAVHLGAQPPMLVRGFYYDAWHMAGTPTKERLTEDFLQHVNFHVVRGVRLDPEHALRVVFKVMCDKIDPVTSRNRSECFLANCAVCGRHPAVSRPPGAEAGREAM